MYLAVAATSSPLGIALSLATAFLWALSPMLMASAGRRIGSVNTVVSRAAIAALLLLVTLPSYAWATGQELSSLWPNRAQLGWLVASGVMGMVVGDFLIYESLVLIGPRRTVQILTLAPATSVALGWSVLDEEFRGRTLLGVILVIVGTSYAVFAGRRPDLDENGKGTEPGGIHALGLLFAFGGAVCTGIGAVTGRKAFQLGQLDSLAATTVRVWTCAVCMWMVPLATGRVVTVLKSLRDRTALQRIVLGTLAGAFSGMICYVAALKYAEAGIVSTLVATAPLFIMPMVAFRYRTRITWDVIAAAVVAVLGVALITLRWFD